MNKTLAVTMLLALVLLGCKGSDGDDGKINVTLTSETAFKSQAFAIGCFIVTSSSTQCVCYESGTEYTGAATGSTNCKNVANDVTLVAGDTKISSLSEGSHNYCSTNNTSAVSTLCATGDANTSTASLVKNSGSEGSIGITPQNGEDGSDNNYVVTYTTTGRSITK